MKWQPRLDSTQRDQGSHLTASYRKQNHVSKKKKNVAPSVTLRVSSKRARGAPAVTYRTGAVLNADSRQFSESGHFQPTTQHGQLHPPPSVIIRIGKSSATRLGNFQFQSLLCLPASTSTCSTPMAGVDRFVRADWDP